MGSLWDSLSGNKAARRQTAAIDKQIALETQQTNYQVQATADMMRSAQAQQIAQEYAEKLLSRPIETVDVTLGQSDLDVATDDLMGRRRTARQDYQLKPSSQSRVTSII